MKCPVVLVCWCQGGVEHIWLVCWCQGGVEHIWLVCWCIGVLVHWCMEQAGGWIIECTLVWEGREVGQVFAGSHIYGGLGVRKNKHFLHKAGEDTLLYDSGLTQQV